MWAVIDIGSNTIRLVIYTMENGQPHSMLNKKYSAGLAGYIDKANCISDEGIGVLLEVLSDIKAVLGYIKPEKVFPFGTASLRNSANGDEVISLVKDKCGFDVRILSGKEEAVFDYYGALKNGIGDSGLLVDVGGGSTELTFFKDKEIVTATSMPIGSLNMYRKYVDGLIPTPKEAHSIKKEVKKYLQAMSLPMEELVTQPIYSVGGTARAALKLMREQYGLQDAEGYTYRQLKGLLDGIDGGQKELMRSILRSSPDRVHTLVPGLLIFKTVAKYFHSTSFVISNFGVREGYLMHKLAGGGDICA